MPRFALKVEYHGAPYSGWQRQVGPPSVQARLEGAIRRLQADAPGIAAAGRTDAGVHARGQVAHVDLSGDWDPFRLMEALNAHLRPDPVACWPPRGLTTIGTRGSRHANATMNITSSAAAPHWRSRRGLPGGCVIRWTSRQCKKGPTT